MTKPQIDPRLLRQLILELLPTIRKTKTASNAQGKTQLAVLLFEAHRTGAYRAWGYRSVGSFVSKAGINPRTLQKYKTAGQRLFEYMPDRYHEVIEAVRTGQEPPWLPQPSKLAALPRRRPGAPVPPELEALLDSPTAKSAMIAMDLQEAQYGAAEGSDLELLRAIDDVCERVDRLDQQLAASWSPEAVELVKTRLHRLEQAYRQGIQRIETARRAAKG